MIEDQFNCRTKSFIYLLWNKRDPTKRQYAGQSGAEVGVRAGQHAYDIDSEADKPVHYGLRPIEGVHFRFGNFASHFIRVQIFQIYFPPILSASKYFR